MSKYIEYIENVTKEEISDFAKKVNLNTIYFLKN